METLKIIDTEDILQVDWFDSNDTFHCFVFFKNTKVGSYTRATERTYETIIY